VFNLNGTWLPSETKPQAPADAKPRSFQFPQVPGGKDTVEVGALGLSLNAASKHTETASEFLAFLMKKTYIDRIGSEALNIPSREDSPAPEALSDAQKAISAATTVAPTYDGAPGVSQGWWDEVLLPLNDQLLSGKITAEQFVEQGKKKTETHLKNTD
jgi:raffinose/stachyose/melibiose transport system substrate-binding protein